jgi:hypothetical protein
VALAASDAAVATMLSTEAYPGRITEDLIKVNQILAAAGTDHNPTVQTRAQAALDNGTGPVLLAFIEKGQYDALVIDQRIKVNQVLADPTAGPRTKNAAQVALDGPAQMLTDFLNSGQYQAALADQDSASHNAGVLAQLEVGQKAAYTAAQNAQLAAKAAAEANKAAAAAAGDATKAQQYADQAAAYAQQAQTSANNAAASASQAQQSANTASAAAAQAANSVTVANNAAHSAQLSKAKADRSSTWAQSSSLDASDSAEAALKDSQEAYADAIAAGKSAQDAAAAAQAKLQQDKNQADASQPPTASGPNDSKGNIRARIGADVGKVAGWISDFAGVFPSFLCGPCSLASLIFGGISALGYIIVPDVLQAFQALAGVALSMVAGKAADEILAGLLKRWGGEMEYLARHYGGAIAKKVPTGMRVKIEWVTNSVSGALGYAYSIKTGSYNDPWDF